MPKHKDLTPKRELFCREYLVDLNQKAAAERAGFKQPQVKGAQLMAVPEVQARIAELQAKVAERNEITVDTILQQLQEDRLLARELKQTSAAVSADIAMAKMSGNWVDRFEMSDAKKSDEQLADELATAFADLLGIDPEAARTHIFNKLSGKVFH